MMSWTKERRAALSRAATAEMHDDKNIAAFPSDYFRLRDFEYAQPLYDLAYLLEIDALSKGQEIPKYRTFSLWRAAYSFDGYSTALDKWLDGQLSDASLDYLPSSRIKAYLCNIRQLGTIRELESYSSPGYRRALRLRAVKGLGIAHIASTLVEAESPSEQWLSKAIAGTQLSRQEIMDVYHGGYGTWQTAHIVPPLLRLLNALHLQSDNNVVYSMDSAIDGIRPITSLFTVQMCGSTTIEELRDLLAKQPLFTLVSDDVDGFTIAHQLGWRFKLQFVTSQHRVDLAAWAYVADPLLQTTGNIKADLHLHTSWSDGNASLTSMSSAIKDSGLEYFAITDHSRSCKLQGGLTPSLWLRQAASISLNRPICPILHGIEVDILDDGALDLPAGLLIGMDIVVASVHSSWTADEHTNTLRLIKAIESGLIDIIGHPTSAIIGKPGAPNYVRPPAKVNWGGVFDHCAKWKVALELNCFPSRLDLPLDMLAKAAEAGCWISLGSDAHARSHLRHLKFGQTILNKLDSQKVLNLLSFAELKEWLQTARRVRTGLPKTTQLCEQPDLFAEVSRIQRRPIRAYLNPPQRIPEGSKIIGFDLTAGKGKATGVALLDGFDVETWSLESDWELIDFVVRNKPAIVSIDSPLGFPGGGSEIDQSAGIVRVAEHDLSSVGIPAYPALIDSMKDLTVRGVALKHRIQALDNPPIVIESYPGAAQDVLSIPRKQKGLELLRDGLRELGITGTGLLTESHDEMDAITSAVVGRFYETGAFMGMGIPSEAQLIVPKVRPLRFELAPIICLTGKTGAGKSVVARYLALFYGFKWVKTRDLIRDILIEDSQLGQSKRLYSKEISAHGITNQDLRDGGIIILEKHKQAPLRIKLRKAIDSSDEPSVVDSIRDVTDLDSTYTKRPIYIWFVDSTDSIISSRLAEKAKIPSFKGRPTMHPIDQKVSVFREHADYALLNTGTLEDLRWRIDDTLFQMVSFTKC
jgi:histidinol phosphatase-like PHP family hydrolase/predicted nuclease with RNAse H fold/dephospho-CoA kinase